MPIHYKINKTSVFLLTYMEDQLDFVPWFLFFLVMLVTILPLLFPSSKAFTRKKKNGFHSINYEQWIDMNQPAKPICFL